MQENASIRNSGHDQESDLIDDPVRRHENVRRYEKVRPLQRRFTSSGDWMPLIGMIIDDDVPFSLENPQKHETSVNSQHVEVTDGTLDDQIHIALITSTPKSNDLITMYEFGVRDIVACSIYPDLEYLSRAIAVQQPSCARLRQAIAASARENGLAVIDDLIAIDTDKTFRTQDVTEKLGLCYASLCGTTKDIYLLSKTLRRMPMSISPLAACYCRSNTYDYVVLEGEQG